MIAEETTRALLVGYQFEDETVIDQAEVRSILERYLADCRIIEQGVI
jgi:hypothetical protein